VGNVFTVKKTHQKHDSNNIVILSATEKPYCSAMLCTKNKHDTNNIPTSRTRLDVPTPLHNIKRDRKTRVPFSVGLRIIIFGRRREQHSTRHSYFTVNSKCVSLSLTLHREHHYEVSLTLQGTFFYRQRGSSPSTRRVLNVWTIKMNTNTYISSAFTFPTSSHHSPKNNDRPPYKHQPPQSSSTTIVH
jgi:hypothetical protein